MVVGVFLPFFPVFLAGRGLSESQIAIILAAPLAIRIVFAPVTGAIADRLSDRRYAIIAYAWIAAISFAGFYYGGGFWWVLAVASVFAVFWTAVVPVADSIALSLVHHTGADYGRLRLWGSVAFIVANLSAGPFLEGRTSQAVFWLILALLAVTAFSSFLVPATAGLVSQQPTLQTPSATARYLNRRYLLVVGAASVALAGHAMVYGFGTLYWEAIGLPRWQIGGLWAIGVAAEVILFALSSKVLDRVGATGLIAIGALATVIRWMLFPFVDAIAGIAFLQVLHGLTFGATYLGAVHFISRAVPERFAAQAQGMFATIGGGAMAATMLTTGALYSRFQADGFMAMALLGVVAIVMLGFERHYRRDER